MASHPVRLCFYCKQDLGNCTYYEISDKTKAGGRDWSSMVGETYCKACYVRYSRTGSFKGAFSEDASSVSLPADGMKRSTRLQDKATSAACHNSSLEGLSLSIGVSAKVSGADALTCASGSSAAEADQSLKLYSLRPSLILPDQEYISTDSESEDTNSNSQSVSAGPMLLDRPDILNSSK